MPPQVVEGWGTGLSRWAARVQPKAVPAVHGRPRLSTPERATGRSASATRFPPAAGAAPSKEIIRRLEPIFLGEIWGYLCN